MKKFDLNIEEILEDWEVSHAVRELIANALDEQLLTDTKEVEIFKDGSSWIIRDFGRGIQYTHLTQNEDQEKLESPNTIGKFGVGLKDALATFDRNQVEVVARSRHCQITIQKSNKEGFSDVVTLHAVIQEPLDPSFIGTEFELIGASDEDVENAKKLFLRFSGERIIESTKWGQIVETNGGHGNIYINGVKVAEEANFLFSYNITALNALIKKALNRERANVGRSAYASSVKKILLASASKEVAEVLAKDLVNISRGFPHDELSWIDVQEHSVKILNQGGNDLFVTAEEAMQSPDMVDHAKNSGYRVVIIPENLREKIHFSKDLAGNPIVDARQFISEYENNYEFSFIGPEELNERERAIYNLTPYIIKLFGGLPEIVRSIRISTTMRKSFLTEATTPLGLWDSPTGTIILSQKALGSISTYSGTLIHELVHAKTGEDDVTRAFENSLTEAIGRLCELALVRNFRRT